MEKESQSNFSHSKHNTSQSHDFHHMDSTLAALKASSMSKSSMTSKFSSSTANQNKKLKQDFQKKLAELTSHNRKFVAT